MKPRSLFDRITIIGLGLIGSSIARAVREKHLAEVITAMDSNEVSLAFARKGGFIDLAQGMPTLADSNMVIIATPPSSLGVVASAIGPYLRSGMIVMDVCSVKQAAIAAISPHMPPGVDYMPAHPIAGSEQSGVSAGRADLFERKRVIVTPETAMQNQVLQNITSFWQGMGARVEGMPPHLHDLIYGYVSHLPQLLAFASAHSLDAYKTAEDATLQKFLRLTGSKPSLWADIFVLNRDNILPALDRYLDAIHHIQRELAQPPKEEKGEGDDRTARIMLFPRIAASCLVTTVMEAEKKAGFTFARYAGTGFADFTAPVAAAPEGDIEKISSHHKMVAAVLGEYAERLKKLRTALAAGTIGTMEKALMAALRT